MKEELLEAIQEILLSPTSIKNHVDRVAEIRVKLEDLLTDEEKYKLTSDIKTKVQKEALDAWVASGFRGAVYMATGTGKSKIGVDIINKIVNDNLGKPLLSVPTEKLRDNNWKLEFEKWNSSYSWGAVERCCYASLNKYEAEEFAVVILDEGHNITENNSQFFKYNRVERLLVLTATEPRDLIKREIFKNLGIHAVYTLDLDEAVKLGLVAPYEITIFTTELDNVDKYVKSGSKLKPFYQTEKAKYAYLSSVVYAAPTKRNFIERMRFIYNLRSKTRAAKWILQNLIPEDLRTFIFCGSIEQADELADSHTYELITENEIKVIEEPITFHSESSDKFFEMFQQGEVSRLTCVNSLNEGHDINNIDCAFIVQLNSNKLHLIQRIGRAIRYKPGKKGRIFILGAEGTVDIEWIKKSTEGISATITTIPLKTITSAQQGKALINF